MKTRKAQMKMMESLFVLIIITVLIGFGLIFYFILNAGEAQEARERNAEFIMEELIERSLVMPELECPPSINVISSNCYDMYKVRVMAEQQEQDQGNHIDQFRNVFSRSKIIVNQLYPHEESYVIYNNPNTRATYIQRTVVPISIYDPLNKRYHYGVLNVTYYS